MINNGKVITVNAVKCRSLKTLCVCSFCFSPHAICTLILVSAGQNPIGYNNCTCSIQSFSVHGSMYTIFIKLVHSVCSHVYYVVLY